MADDAAQEARSARKKPGRPALPLTRKRGVPMRVWTSYAERNLIENKARAADLPVAEFMRRAALGKAVEVFSVPEVNHEARRQLTAIGHHLNRIVRAVESGDAAPLSDDLRDQLVALRIQTDTLALAMLTGVPVEAQSHFASPALASEPGAQSHFAPHVTSPDTRPQSDFAAPAGEVGGAM